MLNEMALESINSALKQNLIEGGPDVTLWPLQTLDKFHNGVFWFTICKRDEKPNRVLTLRFDPAKEVKYPGPAYLLASQPQIVDAIRKFWDGATCESGRVVSIPSA